MSRFQPITRSTDYLFPPSINDWLPEQHLARFVVEIVEQLDLGEMERTYRGTGSLPFHPALLLSVLTYGYATGVFSSCKLPLMIRWHSDTLQRTRTPTTTP